MHGPKTVQAVCTAALLLLATALPLKAAETHHRNVHLELFGGSQYMTGDSQFSIGGLVQTRSGEIPLNRTLSELDFPLDVWLWSVGGTLEVAQRFNFGALYSENITDDAGTVTDADFGVFRFGGASPPSATDTSLDIFSQSDASLDARMLDLSAEYGFYKLKNWTLRVGFLYTYQKFEYDVSNLRQQFPSLGALGGVEFVSGPVARYEVEYKIPMVTLGLHLAGGKRFGLDARFGYAWQATAEDRGDWLLRDLVLIGDTDGPAYRFSLKGRFDITQSWFVKAGVAYLKVDADGTQNQFVHDRFQATIDDRIEIDQTLVDVMFGFRF